MARLLPRKKVETICLSFRWDLSDRFTHRSDVRWQRTMLDKAHTDIQHPAYEIYSHRLRFVGRVVLRFTRASVGAVLTAFATGADSMVVA